eukprot:3031341-Prymnesium_polylepis.1
MIKSVAVMAYAAHVDTAARTRARNPQPGPVVVSSSRIFAVVGLHRCMQLRRRLDRGGEARLQRRQRGRRRRQRWRRRRRRGRWRQRRRRRPRRQHGAHDRHLSDGGACVGIGAAHEFEKERRRVDWTSTLAWSQAPLGSPLIMLHALEPAASTSRSAVRLPRARYQKDTVDTPWPDGAHAEPSYARVNRSPGALAKLDSA